MTWIPVLAAGRGRKKCKLPGGRVVLRSRSHGMPEARSVRAGKHRNKGEKRNCQAKTRRTREKVIVLLGIVSKKTRLAIF